MAELPELPDGIRRLHALRWEDLIEQRGFLGDHFKWHGADRVGDPNGIDSIGVTETIELAKTRFDGLVADYLVSSGTNGDSEKVSQILELLKASVTREVGDVWHTSEWHTAWFERACRERVDEELAALIKVWKSAARSFEILRLEKPHLTLSSLIKTYGLENAATPELGNVTLGAVGRRLAPIRTTDSPKAVEEESHSLGAVPKTVAAKEPPVGASDPVVKTFSQLSTRDASVHDVVGTDNFRNLTNAEIIKSFGKRLRNDFQLKSGEDAPKSCLDRIRRAKGYPLSRQITKKRSMRK